MFREPLRRMTSGSGEVVMNIPQLPTDPASSPASVEASPETSPETRPNFDPDEPSTTAIPAPPEDGSRSVAAGEATIAARPPSQDSGLMEVPSRTVEAGVRDSTAGAENSPDKIGYTPPKLEGVPPEAKSAAEALAKFLGAKDLEERLRHTLAPETMRDYMERYYAVNSSGPVQVDTIAFVRLDPKPQMGSGAHAVFGLECRAWQYPVPVMLEETTDGFRVDWLSFVEFKDRLLERFFKEYTEGPARFHVGLTRAHYFEGGVPNADKKDAFTVTTAPPNPFQATVFVDKESALGKQLKERVSWGTQVWAIAELEWIKLGAQQWVELAAVPQLNWYSVPTNKTTMPARAPDTPTEIQKAVPIGR
jgi:hypothetical protein